MRARKGEPVCLPRSGRDHHFWTDVGRWQSESGHTSYSMSRRIKCLSRHHGSVRLAGIFSVTTAYAVLPNWAVRLTVSRVFADNSYDTDVLVLGVAYRF